MQNRYATDWWMDGWIDRLIGKWMDGQKGERTYQQMKTNIMLN